MKKNYIAPEMLLQVVEMLPLMSGGSINIENNGGLNNPIQTGGEAGDGEGSDSRRTYNVWDDEEEEEL